jgi:hypothetical protein
MRAHEIINESFPMAQQEFSQVATPDEVNKTIASFRDALNKNKLSGAEKDINTWRKLGWDKFKEFVSNLSQIQTKTEVKKAKNTGNFVTLVDNAVWTIVVPLDMDASAHYGRNSDWCTTKREQKYFYTYFLSNNITLVYCIQKQTGNKWAMAIDPSSEIMELFDIKDAKLTAEEFTAQTGLDVARIREMALKKQGKIDTGRDDLHTAKGTSAKGAKMLELMLSINRAGFYNGMGGYEKVEQMYPKIKQAEADFGYSFANDLTQLLELSIEAGDNASDNDDYADDYENHMAFMERAHKTSPIPWEEGWF